MLEPLRPEPMIKQSRMMTPSLAHAREVVSALPPQVSGWHHQVVYETFPHTADIGLRVESPTLRGLFIESAEALYSVMVGHTDGTPAGPRRLSVDGSDIALLLFDWLSELLYLFDTELVSLTDIVVDLGPDGLSAQGAARTVEPSQVVREVKAITYHGLTVVEENGRWRAELVVDI